MSELFSQQPKFYSNANENQIKLAKHQNPFVSLFPSDSLILYSINDSCKLNKAFGLGNVIVVK